MCLCLYMYDCACVLGIIKFIGGVIERLNELLCSLQENAYELMFDFFLKCMFVRVY